MMTLVEQLDKGHWLKPKAAKRRSGRPQKSYKHRQERRRAKNIPDCVPGYRRYKGWEP